MKLPFNSNESSQQPPKNPDSDRSFNLAADEEITIVSLDQKKVTSRQESTSIQGGVAGTALPLTGIPTTPPKSARSTSTPAVSATPTRGRWSPSVHSLLEQPPASLPLRLIIGGMIFSVAFGAWAWFGQIEEVGKAAGRLVPEGQTYKVQPVDSGKVERVTVKEGQTVKAGQVIAELDTTLAEKEVERLEQEITAYQNEILQKQSLLERVQMESQTRGAIASAEELAQRSAIALANEKAATTRQLLIQQQQEAQAYRARQARLRPLSKKARERLRQLQAEVEANQKRLDRLKPLAEEGAVSQEYVFGAEQTLRETQQKIIQAQLQELPSANEQLFQAEQSLRDIEARIIQNQGELATTAKEAEQLEAQIVQKRAEAQQLQLETSQKIQQYQLEIAQTQAKIAQSKNQLAAAKVKLKNNYLRAPIDGVVLALNLNNTGEVIQAGKTVAEIAPEGAPLVLSAVLPNQDAGFVKEGMPVKIKLDAYPYQDYGVISGKVTNISADAKSDDKLGPVYRVEIELERDYVTDEQQKIEFKAGQTASADIIIRRRRIADVLLDPIRQMQKDGINL
jgi:hemolysin D